ncbi:MAG TPA: ComF family protein [Methylotenera sp.]|nr:ComF family protein [Methylotenera sp.]
MKQLINNWLKNSHLFNFNYFKEALFRQNCVLCNAYIDALEATNAQVNRHAVCSPCLNDLPWHPKTSCPQCGLASSGAGLYRTVCGNCINSAPDFDTTHAVFLYQFPIDSMMQRYKYGKSLNIGNIFGQFLGIKMQPEAHADNIDLVIPMPMHPQRLKERGFNQALEIAKVLTKNCKEKLDFKSVIRQTLTPPQASLPLKERVKNIKGAFKVNGDSPNQFQGKRIAIVDDVMTSGASLNELAKTIKQAGAVHVECWVIARTLPHT